MHVLPLPFGLALAVLPRRDAQLLRPEKAPIRVSRGPSHRERVLSDPTLASYRRQIV
jgi:hypothetical protein